MATEYTLGASASCSDGHCGEVIRTILDPAARTLTHLVIEPHHHQEGGRLVPVALIEAAGDEVRLRCSLAEFEGLEPAEEVQLAEGLDFSGGYGPDAVQGYGNFGQAGSGMGIGMPTGHRTPTVTSDSVPEGEEEIASHDRVQATDGEVGQVKGFLVDEADHRLTHVLVRAGHRWSHKDIAIPVDAVADLNDGIWLKITKKQVEALPPL